MHADALTATYGWMLFVHMQSGGHEWDMTVGQKLEDCKAEDELENLRERENLYFRCETF